MATQGAGITHQEDPLWRALAAMRIEPAGAALTFQRRLAREQSWRPAYAQRVMEEYRRFLYLAATAPGQVTPSRQVDEAWHLHLAYTRHYWEELCGRVLPAPLHHNPTEGGPAERKRYFDQYAATLERYEDAFGAPPPADIWPDPETRFAPPRRPLAARLGFAAAASLLVAACAALSGNAGPTPWEWVVNDHFLMLVIPSAIGAFIFGTLASAILGAKVLRQREDGTHSLFTYDQGGGSPGTDGEGCGGGCGGCS